jgi:hypothetical protein
MNAMTLLIKKLKVSSFLTQPQQSGKNSTVNQLSSYSAYSLKLYNIIFLTGEDEYSQDRFPAIY